MEKATGHESPEYGAYLFEIHIEMGWRDRESGRETERGRGGTIESEKIPNPGKQLKFILLEIHRKHIWINIKRANFSTMWDNSNEWKM